MRRPVKQVTNEIDAMCPECEQYCCIDYVDNDGCCPDEFLSACCEAFAVNADGSEWAPVVVEVW